MNILSYILGEEILLYDEFNKAIYRLNPSAGFIWYCFEEGMAMDHIASELARRFAITQRQAQADVNNAVNEWRRLGFLEKEPFVEERIHKEVELTNLANQKAGISWRQKIQTDYYVEYWFELFDQTVSIKFSGEALPRSALNAIQPLEIEVREGQPDHLIEVIKISNGYTIYSGDQLLAHCAHANELAPLLLAHTISKVYFETGCLMAMHAAAVGLNNECIILPAMSGNGKSTLTAALVGSGFEYYTDELVLVTYNTHRVISAQVGIGLKPESWPVLMKFHPDLASLTTHYRQDGKYVRYLIPPTLSSHRKNNEMLTSRVLIFPAYQPGQAVSVSPITSADALCRLAEAGYDVKGGLDRERVEELIAWISMQQCYELCFDDLDEVIAEIRRLLA